MIFILKYELPKVSLLKHLAIVKRIEKYYGDNQRHLMPTTFLIKSTHSANTIYLVLRLILKSFDLDIEKYEFFISPLISNRARMKFNLDDASTKWIKAKIETTPVISFPNLSLASIKKTLEKLTK